MYRLYPEDTPAQVSIVAVARSQLVSAIDETKLHDSQEAAHQIRKRCKKMRALLRLIRCVNDHSEELYQFENARYRTINQLLSSSRDAVSLCEAVTKQLGDQFPHTTACLQQRTATDNSNQLKETHGLLQRGERHIHGWQLEQLSWKDLRRGYRASYRKTTKALQKATNKEDEKSFHELRKRVKDHWYHSRLLEERYPRKIGRRVKPLKALASDLGDWRDLRLLCHFLALNSASLDCGARMELIPLLDSAQQRLVFLRARIDRRCQKLFPRKHWHKQKKR